MLRENRMRGNAHVRLGGGLGETERTERPPPRLEPTQSYRQGRHRRAGQGPPRGLERRPPPRTTAARPRAQRRPVRALEEPREPDRTPSTQARADPETQPPPV